MINTYFRFKFIIIWEHKDLARLWLHNLSMKMCELVWYGQDILYIIACFKSWESVYLWPLIGWILAHSVRIDMTRRGSAYRPRSPGLLISFQTWLLELPMPRPHPYYYWTSFWYQQYPISYFRLFPTQQTVTHCTQPPLAVLLPPWCFTN